MPRPRRLLNRCHRALTDSQLPQTAILFPDVGETSAYDLAGIRRRAGGPDDLFAHDDDRIAAHADELDAMRTVVRLVRDLSVTQTRHHIIAGGYPVDRSVHEKIGREERVLDCLPITPPSGRLEALLGIENGHDTRICGR